MASSASTSRTNCRRASNAEEKRRQSKVLRSSRYGDRFHCRKRVEKKVGSRFPKLRRVGEDLPIAAATRTAVIEAEHMARNRAQQHSASLLACRISDERPAAIRARTRRS